MANPEVIRHGVLIQAAVLRTGLWFRKVPRKHSLISCWATMLKRSFLSGEMHASRSGLHTALEPEEKKKKENSSTLSRKLMVQSPTKILFVRVTDKGGQNAATTSNTQRSYNATIPLGYDSCIATEGRRAITSQASARCVTWCFVGLRDHKRVGSDSSLSCS